MGVFTKYLLRSIVEKKGRTFLLIIAISISAALLIGSLGSIKALLGTINTQIKGNLGDYNINVMPGKGAEVPLVKGADVKDDNIKKTFKTINLGGYITDKDENQVSLMGTTIEDFKTFNMVTMLKKDNLDPFTGKKVIISKLASEKLDLSLGNEVKLTILGKEYQYKVVGITDNKGMFFEDKEKAFTFVTPEENIAEIYDKKNMYSSMLCQVESKGIKKWVEDFNNKNKDKNIIAAEIFDAKQIEEQANQLKMPLYFMLSIVILMTTFIIYNSFKTIITERLPIIGTFLSQGATRGSIIKILIKESFAYGIIGGIVGDLMGVGLTYAIAVLTNPFKAQGIKATVDYHIPYFIIGFGFAVVLSVVASLLPILKTRKLPVKEVILNTLISKNEISIKGFILGVVFIAVAIIMHFVKPDSYIVAVETFLIFIGVILVVPMVVTIILTPIVKLLRNINGVTMLAFNNVITSKILINNIRLLVVSIMAVMMISSMGTSFKDTLTGAYSGMNHDVSVGGITKTYYKQIKEAIDKNKNIETIYSSSWVYANIDGDNSKVIAINSTDLTTYSSFENYIGYEDKEKQLDELDKSDNGIILARQLSARYNIKKGDTIKVKVDDAEVSLKVLSIMNTKMMNGGNYNLISRKTGERYFGVKNPTTISFKVKGSADDVKKELEKDIKGLRANISTKADQIKRDEEGTAMMVNILSVFSYMTMIIGSFGVISNMAISFLQRKREMAIVSSVGLTKGSRNYIIMLEGIFQGLIGLGIALLGLFGINMAVSDLFKLLTLEMEIKYPVKSILGVLMVTLVIMLLTSLTSLFRSRKLVIVNELKCD